MQQQQQQNAMVSQHKVAANMSEQERIKMVQQQNMMN